MQSQIAEFEEPNLNDCIIQSTSNNSFSSNESVIGNVLSIFDPAHHAHIKMSILMKNNNLNEVPEEYVFTKDFGRIPGSLSWHDETRIVLGRPGPRQTHNIDIDIRNNMRVSQLHCQVLTDKGWHQRGRLSREFIQFLKAASTKNNLWYRLPKDLHRLIWQYAAHKPTFYIQDLGSKYGTYIKLKTARQLKQNAVFTIGFYSMIKILKIQQHKPIQQYPELKTMWCNVGLIEVGSLQPTAESTHFSYTMICVEDYRGKTRQNYVLTCLNTQQSTITIGRHLSNHIVITHSEVSRKHCTLRCEKGEWMILDGTGPGHQSSNGTWVDVRTVQEIDGGGISQPRELQNLDEIKIGETYIRFEILNN